MKLRALRCLRYSNFLVDILTTKAIAALWGGRPRPRPTPGRPLLCTAQAAGRWRPARTRGSAPLLALVFLNACQKMPETYAPPEQRKPIENFRPYHITRVVDMSDGDADSHIVRDILPAGGGPWRWAGQRPAVHVTLRQVENLIYIIDFSIADATFKVTGPVTLKFFVNDHLLDSMAYSSPGTYHFEKPVPSNWVEAGKEATLSAEVDKVWVAPDDGAKLGFVLTRIGMRQDKSKK
jgi:hypothetical protein